MQIGTFFVESGFALSDLHRQSRLRMNIVRKDDAPQVIRTSASSAVSQKNDVDLYLSNKMI